MYNAVIDGADAVMLSGESSVGKYPIEAVRVMNEIVRVAQGNMPKRNPGDYDSSNQAVTETICHAACTIASEFKSVDFNGKIIVITNQGRSARLISKYRPELPILAFSDSERTVRELAMVWGIRAHHFPHGDLPLEEKAMSAIITAKKIGYLSRDDEKVCVISSSQYIGAGAYTGIYDLNALNHYEMATKMGNRPHNTRASMV